MRIWRFNLHNFSTKGLEFPVVSITEEKIDIRADYAKVMEILDS